MNMRFLFISMRYFLDPHAGPGNAVMAPDTLETEEEIRWQATNMLAKNVDRSFDARLKALLEDRDLRKRGLAAYIAARVWKQESYPILRQMLRERTELLRFDAISALALDGSPEARQLLLQHRRIETHPTLIRLIDKTVKP